MKAATFGICSFAILTASLVIDPARATGRPGRAINLTLAATGHAATARTATRASSRGRVRRYFATPYDAILAADARPRTSRSAHGTDPIAQLDFAGTGPWHQDVRRGYRDLTERVSRRVWDDPQGRRIVFDVDGRPGIGVEIPLQ